MNRVLSVVAGVSFAASLFQRMIDPVIPQIALDFRVDPATAALLSTAFAIPYAFVQPVLGGMADLLGKTRLMAGCIVVLALATLAGAVATDLPTLFVARAIAGMASGGVFPIALAITGDLVPLGNRQLALSRLIAITLAGGLIGAVVGGIVGDLIGWRGVFFGGAGLAVMAFLSMIFGLRGVETDAPARLDFGLLRANYLAIFRNPLAKICFGAVFLEGIFVWGLFPHLAALLYAEGETRAVIAGVVLAGFGFGGIIYAFILPRLLASLGAHKLMVIGGALVGVGLAATALRLVWQAEFLDFMLMGCAFYMLHGSIHVYVTELAPAGRGAAAALHSAFFFVGQGVGPIVYGLGFAHMGPTPMLLASAAMIALVGVWCALALHHRHVKE
jgi:predicted MFS family arabinose efflux permease